jgi:hypothetical protein
MFTEKFKLGDLFLTAVWENVGIIFKDCHKGLKDTWAREWDHILFWLKSSCREGVASGTMNIHQKEKTVTEYSSHWQKFLCFCFCTMDLELSQAADGCFQFTADQHQDLKEMCDYY